MRVKERDEIVIIKLIEIILLAHSALNCILGAS